MWDLFSDADRPPTVFPAPIALAAAFDHELLHRVAGAIADETRAKANIYLAKENKVRWAPRVPSSPLTDLCSMCIRNLSSCTAAQ